MSWLRFFGVGPWLNPFSIRLNPLWKSQFLGRILARALALGRKESSKKSFSPPQVGNWNFSPVTQYDAFGPWEWRDSLTGPYRTVSDRSGTERIPSKMAILRLLQMAWLSKKWDFLKCHTYQTIYNIDSKPKIYSRSKFSKLEHLRSPGRDLNEKKMKPASETISKKSYI